MALLKDKVRSIKTRNFICGNPNISQIYYKKGVFYGDYLDETKYNKVLLSFSNKQRLSYAKSLKTEKRADSLLRTRQSIYRIVHANVGKHGSFAPVFSTLTYEKSQTSLMSARREFSYFSKKLSGYLGHKIAYLAVPEIQKARYDKYGDAVWHFHIVYFNVPFVPLQTYKQLWGFGSVDLQLIHKINDIGAYISKYLSKDTYDNRLYGQRAYQCSRGLLRPLTSFDDVEIDNFISRAKVKLLDRKQYNHLTISKWKQHK